MSDIDFDFPLYRLRGLGIPNNPWPDYLSQFGIISTHIPGLLKMALTEINIEEDEEDGDIYPEDFANVHAWRALGQLRAVETIPELATLFFWEVADKYAWIPDDLPLTFGLMGLSALPLMTRIAEDVETPFLPRSAAIDSIGEIARQPYVDTKYAVQPLMELLRKYSANEIWLNDKLVFLFSRLRVQAAYPLVKTVYQAGLLSAWAYGDWEDFQVFVGLLPERLTTVSRKIPPLLMAHPNTTSN